MDVLYAVNVYKASCDGFNFFPSETKRVQARPSDLTAAACTTATTQMRRTSVLYQVLGSLSIR